MVSNDRSEIMKDFMRQAAQIESKRLLEIPAAFSIPECNNTYYSYKKYIRNSVFSVISAY